MNGNDCEGLGDIDTLQRSIKRIVQGYINEIKQLRINLSQKEADNNKLIRENILITKQIKEHEERSKLCKCRGADLLISEAKDSQFEGFHDEILKEVQDISTLELDSQFVSDNDSNNEKNIIAPSHTNMLEKLFVSGIGTQPYNDLHVNNNLTPPRPIDDTILVAESPTSKRFAASACLYIPETMQPNYNETTPRKSNNIINDMVDDEENNTLIEDAHKRLIKFESPKSSPVIRLTPSDKLMGDRKVPFNMSQLISPSRRLNHCLTKGNGIETSKRKLFSIKQPQSPKRSRTPRKKISTLKNSNRMEAELSYNGVRKLTQTQLNIACFKKFKSNENLPTDNVLSPIKNEPMDFITSNDEDKYVKPCTPLNSLENSPDLNETNLTASAIRRVANDVVIDVKPVLTSSYDRIPEPASLEGKKAVRKRLPGQECQDCIKFYEAFGYGNEEMKQELLNRCSRHRTKNVALNDTPEGFWKPMLTQTPRKT